MNRYANPNVMRLYHPNHVLSDESNRCVILPGKRIDMSLTSAEFNGLKLARWLWESFGDDIRNAPQHIILTAEQINASLLEAAGSGRNTRFGPADIKQVQINLKMLVRMIGSRFPNCRIGAYNAMSAPNLDLLKFLPAIAPAYAGMHFVCPPIKHQTDPEKHRSTLDKDALAYETCRAIKSAMPETICAPAYWQRFDPNEKRGASTKVYAFDEVPAPMVETRVGRAFDGGADAIVLMTWGDLWSAQQGHANFPKWGKKRRLRREHRRAARLIQDVWDRRAA